MKLPKGVKVYQKNRVFQGEVEVDEQTAQLVNATLNPPKKKETKKK